MKKVLVPLLMLSLLPLLLCGCGKKPENISSIHVAHSSFGITDIEYKIDLENQKLYCFIIEDEEYDESDERDPSGPDEGYQSVINLDSDKIIEFIKEADENHFCDWEERYENDICDGHQWQIDIFYRNGNEQLISGSNAYPKTWDKMYKAFESLTGEIILLFRSYWLR